MFAGNLLSTFVKILSTFRSLFLTMALLFSTFSYGQHISASQKGYYRLWKVIVEFLFILSTQKKK